MLKLAIFFAFAVVLSTEAASLKQAAPQWDEEEGLTDCEKACRNKPMDIAFVVDASASIWQVNFTLGLNFIEDFVNIFEISPTVVRVALVTFGMEAYGEDAFGFTAYSNKDKLKEAISNVPYRSGQFTDTSGGIRYMLRNHRPEARADVRKIAIVLTDGNSQETQETIDAAREAREEDLEVFAVGIGQAVSPQELRNIASDDSNVFMVSAYNMLEGIKRRMAYKACEKPPEKVCRTEPVDLSFVIDSSVSIGEGNFTVGMEFVKEFVEGFEVNPSAVKVSAITFGEDVYVQDAFNFDTYKDKKQVLNTLENIKWRHGSATNTGAGIKYMRKNQMASARPDAAHVCIVLTDGKSQETQKTKTEAKKAQGKGIVMYAVGVGEIGSQLSGQELEDIAGTPNRVLVAENYAKLNLIKQDLIKITCTGISEARALLTARYGERPT